MANDGDEVRGVADFAPEEGEEEVEGGCPCELGTPEDS